MGHPFSYRLGLCSSARHCGSCQPIRSAMPAVSKVIWRRVVGNPHSWRAGPFHYLYAHGDYMLSPMSHTNSSISPHLARAWPSQGPVPCDLDARPCRRGTQQLRRSLLCVNSGRGNLSGRQRHSEPPEMGRCVGAPTTRWRRSPQAERA